LRPFVYVITLKVQGVRGQRFASVFAKIERVWRAASSDLPTREREDGFALTDALVAMLILSMTLVLSLTALGKARDVADVAWETRRAQSLLSHLIETAPHSFEPGAGVSDAFTWAVETTTTGADRPVAVCRRAVSLENRLSRRTYQAATLEACPLLTPA